MVVHLYVCKVIKKTRNYQIIQSKPHVLSSHLEQNQLHKTLSYINYHSIALTE